MGRYLEKLKFIYNGVKPLALARGSVKDCESRACVPAFLLFTHIRIHNFINKLKGAE